MSDQRSMNDDVTQAAGPDGALAREADLINRARAEAGAAGAPATDSTDRLRNAPKIDGYEFVRELHRGGQGVVYQALEKATKRKVAIKVLLEGPYASDHARRRFEREIELAASLKHPNIVPVFHSGITPDGRQFCVMDYVRGVPLHQYVREQKLGLEDALKLFAKVCEAVNYAHQKGIIHRDLKPSNILVDSDGSPKVLDFGLAKLIGGPEQTLVSMTGQVVGTLPYLSPEQARGNPDEIDIRTDVYSLGVVLYEMLTGHFPYPVIGQMADVLRHIASTEPAPPSRSWKPDSGVTQRTSGRKSKLGSCPIDDEVQTIVLRALTKERQRRYQSAAEIGHDVEHYLRNEPIEAKKDSPLYVLSKLLVRYRVPASIAALFFILLIVFAITMSVMAKRNRVLASNESYAKRAAIAAADEARTARDVARLATTQAVAAQRKAEIDAYCANLASAEAAVSANEYARLRKCLDVCPTSLRGWEWYWFDAMTDNSLMMLASKGRLLSGAILEKGTLLLTQETDGTTQILDMEHRCDTVTLSQKLDWIFQGAFDANGTHVLTRSRAGKITIWNATTGEPLVDINIGIQGTVSRFSLSNNGSLILTCDTKSANLWDTATGTLARKLLDGEAVRFATFNHTGDKVIVVTEKGTISVLNALTGANVLTLQGEHINASASICQSGARIVTQSNEAVQTWDAQTGKRLAIIRSGSNRVYWTRLSPDGRRLVGGVGNLARIWNPETGEMLFELRGHSEPVVSMEFTPDGKRVVTCSYDGSARIWDVDDGRELCVLRGHRAPVGIPVISNDGTRVLTFAGDYRARVWNIMDLADLGVLRGHEDSVSSAKFSSDGTRIVTASVDRSARIWDSTTGKCLNILRGHSDAVRSAMFSVDGTKVLTTSDDKTARLWDASAAAELFMMSGHSDRVGSASFSSDERTIVTADFWGHVFFWDATSGERKSELPKLAVGVNGAVFNRDSSNILVWFYDKKLGVFDMNGNRLKTLKGHRGSVAAASYSPDGRFIVSTSYDHTARVWDSENGSTLMVLEEAGLGLGHSTESPPGSEYAPVSAFFDPSGQRIVTAIGEKTAGVWMVPNGVELTLLRGHDGFVASAEFSRDGTRIVTSSTDNTARIWDCVPYRVRYAERQLRGRGVMDVNLGIQYMKEVHHETPATWLSDPTVEEGRPNFAAESN